MSLDLHDAVRSNRLASAGQKQAVLYQLLCAIGYMHAHAVMHRDLKPPNVLLDASCRVQLCDFGLCRTVCEAGGAAAAAVAAATATATAAAAASTASADAPNADSRVPRLDLHISGPPAGGASGLISRSVGSRWYRAPELLLGASAHGTPVDMWSTGCGTPSCMPSSTLLTPFSAVMAATAAQQCVAVPRCPCRTARAALPVPRCPCRASRAALPVPRFPCRAARGHWYPWVPASPPASLSRTQ